MPSKDSPEERKPASEIIFRQPCARDGHTIWELIRKTGSLDENSKYCNLLQCDHFSETCVIAEKASDGTIVGWISGYLMPDDPATLFIWQVAVAASARGQGIAKRMLLALIARQSCSGIRQIKTTITAENTASWRLFDSFTRSQGGTLSRAPYFRKDTHFHGTHATEHLATILLPEHAHQAA